MGGPRLARVLAISRAALLSGVARCQGTLQADRDRRGVGDPAALTDNGCFFNHLRRITARTLRRCSLPCVLLRRPTVLELFFGSAHSLRQQSRRRRQPDLEGLFPPVILPLSAVISLILDFAVAFVILLGMMLFYGIVPGIAVVTLPLFLSLAFMTALACGLCLSAVNIKYRDVAYAIPFLTQFWLFVTPVAYPSTIIPERWRLLYSLNPMAGVVEGFRWALLGQQNVQGEFIFLSTMVVLTLFIGGLFYFRRMEHEFADVV